MANDDVSGEFRKKNKPMSQYWRDVQSALDLPLLTEESLKDDLWPRSRFTLKLINLRMMGHCVRNLL